MDIIGCLLFPRNVMQRITHLAVCVSLLFAGYLQAAETPFVELKGHTERLASAKFSPDGKKIVTASDSTARIWDAETGKELQTLEGHRDGVYLAVFYPDGKKVITGSSDGTVRIWNTETGRELQHLKGHGAGIYTAVFSPDGKIRVVLSDVLDQEVKQAPQYVRDFYGTIPESQIERIVRTDESDTLAEQYIAAGIVTENSLNDSRHVALASVAGVDVLVSFNCTHIVKLKRIRKYNGINMVLGYPQIEIRTPDEVIQ